MNLMKIKDPLIFVSGLTIGGVTAWLLVKEKYKAQAQEEIDSVKEAFANINREAIEKAAVAKNKPDIMSYSSMYTATQTDEESEKPSSIWRDGAVVVEEPKNEEPDDIDIATADSESYIYEITPSAFATDQNDHTKVSFTRFADDVYSDEMYDKIDPREYLNKRLLTLYSNDPVDPIDYIRRMSQDEICIRNYDLRLDIDIATDDRTYRDYMSM